MVGVLGLLASSLVVALPQVATANNGPEYAFGPAGTGCICPAHGGLQAVVGVDTNDAWAFGYRMPGGGAKNLRVLAEHWNGILWQVIPTPPPVSPHAGRALFGAAALAWNNVWAVGTRVTNANGADILIEHWNGHRFSVASTPDDKERGGWNRVLDAAFAVSANDVWAVGQQAPYATNNWEPLILHWNGSRWNSFTAENLESEYSALTAISGSGPNNLWAVGKRTGGAGTFAEHYNGSTWRVIPTPPSDGEALYGVTSLSSSDSWAVGPTGFNAVSHWNGWQWKTFESPTPQTVGAMRGIDSRGPDDIWAVGALNGQQAILENWNGEQWTLYPSPLIRNKNPVLYGVAIVSSDDAWAVGGVSANGNPAGGLIEHWNGVTWRAIVRP
ncbi:MAG TPA: hypothetical protein VG815_01960 [Chloroflexota bacterium]|jgi:hypothetical protein|nr:hypothetical protein [Chloroflexota bacterium]